MPQAVINHPQKKLKLSNQSYTMRSHYSISLVLVLLVSLVSQTYAVTDENICAQECQFCCREKECKSQDECKGNFQPFVILGIVAGALVGLFILRRIYVYCKQQNAKQRKEQQGKKSNRSSRSKQKAPKSKPARSKSMKKEEKKQLKEEVYLQVDNDSVISPDSSVVKAEQPNQDLEKGKADTTIKSKSEIKDDKKKDMKASSASSKPAGTKSDPKKNDKNSSTKTSGASKKPAGSSKAGTAGAKERGRSTGKDGKDGEKKERTTSQKKSSSNKDGKDDKGSKGPKKNQV